MPSKSWDYQPWEGPGSQETPQSRKWHSERKSRAAHEVSVFKGNLLL